MVVIVMEVEEIGENEEVEVEGKVVVVFVLLF